MIGSAEARGPRGLAGEDSVDPLRRLAAVFRERCRERHQRTRANALLRESDEWDLLLQRVQQEHERSRRPG